MKKIFSFFAICAVVLGMASCGGDEPEAKDFQLTVNALWDRAQVRITPAHEGDIYFHYYAKAADVEATEGGIAQYVADQIGSKPWNSWANYFRDKKTKRTFVTLAADTKYIVYVCKVEKYYDEEKEWDAIRIVGDIVSQEFTTTKNHRLNGVFTVSPTRQVRFASSNIYFNNNTYYDHNYQWNYYGKTQPTTPYDLFPRSIFEGSDAVVFKSAVLKADEWYYLFRERSRAAELIAHAKVNNVPGLIILPDNWQKPEDVELHTDQELNYVWVDSRYINQGLDGYAENTYTVDQWADLEYAGAVFLPAVGKNGSEVKQNGYYWASAETTPVSNLFNFGKDELDLLYLKEAETDAASLNISIRYAYTVQ